MFKTSKQFKVFFLALAVCGFLFLSLGGNYVHTLIHHHDAETEQECPFHQFLVQAFLALIVVLASLFVKPKIFSAFKLQVFTSQALRLLANPRAPPALAYSATQNS